MGFAAAMALIAGWAVPAVAQSPGGPMTVEDFLRQAAESNIADIEAGRMAESTTTVPLSVQQLGRQISGGAMTLNDRLSKLAETHGIKLANQITPADRGALERLSKLQGPLFTREYLRYVLADLERDRAFYQVASGLDDGAVAQFAKEALPEIETELMVARTIYDSQIAARPAAPDRKR